MLVFYHFGGVGASGAFLILVTDFVVVVFGDFSLWGLMASIAF